MSVICFLLYRSKVHFTGSRTVALTLNKALLAVGGGWGDINAMKEKYLKGMESKRIRKI